MLATTLWLTLGVVLLSLYNGLLLLDDKTPEDDVKNKKIETDWHIVGSLVFIYMGLSAWFTFGFWYFPLVISLFWVLFGGIVHFVGLNKPFFYVGKTAATDKLIRKFFKNKPEIFSGVVKILVTLISLALLIIKTN
jgi:hypothetical protein